MYQGFAKELTEKFHLSAGKKYLYSLPGWSARRVARIELQPWPGEKEPRLMVRLNSAYAGRLADVPADAVFEECPEILPVAGSRQAKRLAVLMRRFRFPDVPVEEVEFYREGALYAIKRLLNDRKVKGPVLLDAADCADPVKLPAFRRGVLDTVAWLEGKKGTTATDLLMVAALLERGIVLAD